MANVQGRLVMNCYEILEISPDATLKEINSAYKKLALRHHPDKAEGDAAAREFQKIQEAVEILRNPTRRKEHDNIFSRNHRVYTEEELLFASPGYTGWRPKEMYRRYTSGRDRYTFSYKESVHMNPHSRDSQDELAHWRRQFEEEERTREEMKRNAEAFAEEVEREAERLRGKRQQAEYRWSGLWDLDAPVFKPSNSDLGSELDLDGESDTSQKENVDPELNADSGTDTESEPDLVVEFELGPEFYAEFDISSIANAGSDDDDTDRGETEFSPVNYSEATAGMSVGVNKGREEYASVHTTSPGKTAEYVTASPGSLPKHHTSRSLFSADANSAGNPGDDSASVYYDFSDAAQADSENADDQENEEHDDSHEHERYSTSEGSQCSRSPSNNDLSCLQFLEAEAYPYLVPFIPYFRGKLAQAGGRFTMNDLQKELKGMVMETYCGWLESLRVTIPGAGPAIVCDPDWCRHLGYWKKGFGQENCKKCGIWKPIYTLECSGCGIKKCIVCKFEGDD
ncbi:DnaJ domain-containing protein [Aspergillus karnatakaensis]|uniref:DnaJ domain protein n=1 Tax=Aspergillus karnatakaensis TaxID=1810916 RepID=UPI003CCE5394